MGHKSISSTLEYKRGRLNTRQIDKILSSLDYQKFTPDVKKKRRANKKQVQQDQLKLSQYNQEDQSEQQQATELKEQ